MSNALKTTDKDKPYWFSVQKLVGLHVPVQGDHIADHGGYDANDTAAYDYAMKCPKLAAWQ